MSDEQTVYLGFDCSSKAIHCVALDDEYNIITQKKWGSNHKTFEERFNEITLSFWADLSKIYISKSKNEKDFIQIGI